MKYLLLLMLFISQVSQANIFSLINKNQKKSDPQLLLGGGGMDGGGTGGLREEEGAAWFYADKANGPIKVCYHIAPSFKATEEMIKSAITKSYKTWESYILNSTIYDVDLEEDPNAKYPENLKIATKIKFENCDADSELVFYFGVQDSRVKEVLKGMKDAKGFAFRKYEDIDAIKGTSKGLIWIFDPTQTTDPVDDHFYDWSKQELLQAIINHEVGHTMGVHHQDGTIMQEDLQNLFHISQIPIDHTTSEHTKNLILNYRKYLNKIDHDTQVSFNVSEVKVKGHLGVSGSKIEKKNFKYFMQRDPVGKVEAILEFSQSKNLFTYSINDSSGSRTWQLKDMQVKMSNFKLGGGQFKRVRKVFDSDYNSYDYENDVDTAINTNFLGSINLGQKKLNVSLDLGQSINGYFEKGQNTSELISLSNISLHYFDKNMDPQIMFVENIYDTSEISENLK